VIEVSLLGPPQVQRDDARVRFETRKAVALLALLVMTERPRTRDALAEMLWPDHDPERARAALRRTLSDLRSGIGGELLDATHDHVRLVKGPGLTVDVDRFRELCRAGRIETAVELFRGDLLEGLAVRHAPDFEEWVQIESAQLRRELTQALASLTKEREEAGDLAEALVAARRWVATDPLHEPAHQALIRLYAATGDRGAAMEQYRECVRTLSRELGVPPLRETADLYEAVNRGTYTAPSQPPPRPAPSAAPGAVAEVPFVGRSGELAAARDALDSVGAAGRVVVVEGEAGIGKTRLAEQLLASVRRRGGRVVVGSAYEGESSLSYAPVIEALRARLREDDAWLSSLDRVVRDQVARLLPELADSRRSSDVLTGPDGPGAESRFLSALWTALVAAVNGDRAGALFLDDAQWADDATRTLLAYGLRRLASRPVLVVLAWRTPYDDELRRAAAVTVRSGLGVALRLGRLGRADSSRLTLWAWPDASHDDVQHLWEATEGVPLLQVEYLRAAARDPAGTLPPAAREVLHARLAPVSETGRQVLAAAAVLARPFDADAVRTVSGRTDDETVRALEELVGLGLVVETSEAYDFAHHLVREVVHGETGLARRRLLHARAARVPGTPDASVARHLQQAGRSSEAAVAYWKAAERDLEVFANAEAVEHLSAALALGHPDRAGLLIALGDVQVVTGDYAGALRSLEEAARICPARQRPGVEQRLGRLRHRQGDYPRAVGHLEAALEAARPEDLVLRAGILVDLSQAVDSCGDPLRAEAVAAQALAHAEAAGDPRSVAAARNAEGMLATARGRHDVALEHFGASLALAEEVGDPELKAAALNNTALALGSQGDLDGAVGLMRRALELCRVVGDRHREAALSNNLADLLHEGGRDDEAMEHLKQAVEAFAEVGEDEEPQAGVWRLVRW
jgi:DNA-binding SARP family transcriptional activator